MEYGNRLQIRTVRPESDLADVMRLYESGLLEDGARNSHDSAPDLENLHDSYLHEDGGSHFWVAVLRDDVTLVSGSPPVPRADQPVADAIDDSDRDSDATPVVVVNNGHAASANVPSIPTANPMSDKGEILTPTSGSIAGSGGTPREMIIGMIGAQRTDLHTIEIRRLRVDPAHRQRGVGKRLIETALDFCYEKGYLKVLLDTRVERIPAIALFERFGFQLNRTREVGGKKVHDFYLNLYRHHEASRRRQRDDLGQGSIIVP